MAWYIKSMFLKRLLFALHLNALLRHFRVCLFAFICLFFAFIYMFLSYFYCRDSRLLLGYSYKCLIVKDMFSS